MKEIIQIIKDIYDQIEKVHYDGFLRIEFKSDRVWIQIADRGDVDFLNFEAFYDIYSQIKDLRKFGYETDKNPLTLSSVGTLAKNNWKIVKYFDEVRFPIDIYDQIEKE